MIEKPPSRAEERRERSKAKLLQLRRVRGWQATPPPAPPEGQ